MEKERRANKGYIMPKGGRREEDKQSAKKLQEIVKDGTYRSWRDKKAAWRTSQLVIDRNQVG